MLEILKSELSGNPELKMRITKRLSNNFPERPEMNIETTDKGSEDLKNVFDKLLKGKLSQIKRTDQTE